MRAETILIMAGGTGGHVYPALAVAENLQRQGFKLCWLGTAKGLEVNVVPEHGYPLLTIKVHGVRGKGWVTMLLMPFMLVAALLQALHIMVKIRPVAVLGMGGFASGPGGVAAWLMRIPLIIHEQNAIAGLTNRLLAPFAVSVMAAFPGVFHQSKKLTITGNPVRKSIMDIEQPETRLVNLGQRRIRILVLGGSLGAVKLNRLVPETVSSIEHEFEMHIKHQCGAKHLTLTEERYKNIGVEHDIVAFIDDMAAAYAWADLVICRAGALTIAELAACGVGSILIPFPYAVDDHQTENAKYLVRRDAAILIQETQLTVEKLAELLVQVFRVPERLLRMAVNARSLSRPDATAIITELCMAVAHGR